MDTLIDKSSEIESANWNDDNFHHAYRARGKTWLGGPALCGFKGSGPKFFDKIIPAGACPICLALVLSERGELP